MSTTSRFDELKARIDAGGRLSNPDLAALAATVDILPLGMLADALRRRIHGTQVTYVRVASCAFDRPLADAVPPAAREVRLTGRPETMTAAMEAVQSARAVAGDRTLSAWSWQDVERLALAGRTSIDRVLEALRAGGLDALAEMPMDHAAGLGDAIDRLTAAGYQRLRLTMAKAPAAWRTALFERAAALQDRYACIQAIDPLPAVPDPVHPSSGYEDVKTVALARLAAPNVPTIQVAWERYGPKLAQVALTFGADDLDAVSPSDEAPLGPRRAPVEDVRRNIEAAGFTPAERDGRFNVIA
ncbi:MAG: hypothetical protein HY657_04490 [Acidobacteria bacterium]|nr:hypothetical protein [Acidobacteriota bacterium]